MSRLQNAAITQMRMPVAGKDKYDLALPVTVTDAVIHSETGANLTNLLDEKGVNNAAITIMQDGVFVGSFTLNQEENKIIELTTGMAVPTVDPVFGNNSWATIAAVSEQFIAPYGLSAGAIYSLLGWNIGDTKTFQTFTGTHTVRIIGVNHDNRVGGGKAGLTLELTTGWYPAIDNVDMRRFNSINTSQTGWENSMIRRGAAGSGGIPTGNDTSMVDVLQELPVALRNVIKTVVKPTASWGFRVDTAEPPFIVNSHDDLFLLSVEEVFGLHRVQSWSLPGEGRQYAWYQANNTPDGRTKTRNGGEAWWWWLRSPIPNSAENFSLVSERGTQGSGQAIFTALASFALCI